MKPYYCEKCAFFDELKNEQPCCYCVGGINFVELEEEETTMSKEQIEEMAKIFCGMKNSCDGCMWDKVHCNERNYAEEIYNAGYRKQKWISVDERLPKDCVRVLVYGETDIFIATRLNGGWFAPVHCDGEITHWMPLPEPPMMKGGAE